jgi:uncharacterized protein (DUF1697 family)
VATFRASGNVVFSTTTPAGEHALTERIEGELARLLGYPVVTFLRSGAELREIAAAEPFDAATSARLHGKPQVMLLAEAPPARARREALSLAGEQDALAFGERELFWLPAGGISESPLDMKELARTLGAMTVRTIGTVEQIAARHFGA